jgi:UDP-N-acetylglucosamine acyltransferase
MIHGTAIVSPEARISADVNIGAYAIIDGPVVIGAGCILHAQSRIVGHVTLGARNIIHSHAIIGDFPQDRKYHGEATRVVIGDDNIFREGATVHRSTGPNTQTTIGDRCFFMVNSHAGHNSTVGNDVTLVNGATLGGHVHVADRAIISAFSAIHQYCRVGRLVLISNGANSTVDVPPFFISMGTNCVTQLNAVGLRRSGMSRESINGLRRMFQIAFRQNRHRPLVWALADLPEDVLAVPEVQEVIAFCKTSKRGVATFQPWSQSNLTDVGESMRAED